MSVGERPELPDQEKPPTGARGNGRATSGSARGKRGRPRRAAATGAEDGLDEMDEPSGNGGVATGRGGNGGNGSGGVARERAMRRLLAGLRAIDAGDFSVRLEPAGDPLSAEIAGVFNSVATKQGRLADELNRVALSVGREGKMRDRATIGPAAGLWAGSVDALNSLITDLVQPTSEVARVIKAVAEGDLSQKVELEIEGLGRQRQEFGQA